MLDVHYSVWEAWRSDQQAICWYGLWWLRCMHILALQLCPTPMRPCLCVMPPYKTAPFSINSTHNFPASPSQCFLRAVLWPIILVIDIGKSSLLAQTSMVIVSVRPYQNAQMGLKRVLIVVRKDKGIALVQDEYLRLWFCWSCYLCTLHTLVSSFHCYRNVWSVSHVSFYCNNKSMGQILEKI